LDEEGVIEVLQGERRKKIEEIERLAHVIKGLASSLKKANREMSEKQMELDLLEEKIGWLKGAFCPAHSTRKEGLFTLHFCLLHPKKSYYKQVFYRRKCFGCKKTPEEVRTILTLRKATGWKEGTLEGEEG